MNSKETINTTSPTDLVGCLICYQAKFQSYTGWVRCLFRGTAKDGATIDYLMVQLDDGTDVCYSITPQQVRQILYDPNKTEEEQP